MIEGQLRVSENLQKILELQILVETVSEKLCEGGIRTGS